MFHSITVAFSFPFIQAKEEYERKERKKEQARLSPRGRPAGDRACWPG